MDDKEFIKHLNDFFFHNNKENPVFVKYIYVLREFEECKGFYKNQSLEAAISLILRRNKVLFNGCENYLQCKELVYHGIILNTVYGIMSLHDLLFNKIDDNNIVKKNEKRWDGNAILNIEDKKNDDRIILPKDIVIPIDENDETREILCMLTNWS